MLKTRSFLKEWDTMLSFNSKFMHWQQIVFSRFFEQCLVGVDNPAIGLNRNRLYN